MVDMRSHGPAIVSHARLRKLPVSALIRTILAEWLVAHPDAESAQTTPDTSNDASNRSNILPLPSASLHKVTLRIPVCEALLLARRARSAEMSQGNYVAHLLMEVQAPPASADLREASAALLRSTAMLAALCVDVQALAQSDARSSPQESVLRGLQTDQLTHAVKQHLALAAPLLAALKPARRTLPSRTAE